VGNPRNEVQISLVQLDNYGPWTVTPSPRRETDLQSLQARLYADFAEFVGREDGYAFFDRFDNMIGVTNGIGRDGHERFQETVRNRYPVTVSIGVGAGRTPAGALGAATRQLQYAGSAQDPDRTESLGIDGTVDETDGSLSIAHFDVVDATTSYTDSRDADEVTTTMRRATLSLSTYLKEHHDSIARFVGGDNVIAVCPRLGTEAFARARDHVRDASDVDLRVGIGQGPTAYAAGRRAKLALEECRNSGRRVHRLERRAPTE